MKIDRKKIFIIIIPLIILIMLLIGKSFADPLDNDVRVAGNSELTYYLKVSYDGVDTEGVASSDSVKANVRSGKIYVEDTIPEGLTFDSFITTSSGTIGAVKRDDKSSCLGKVVDDGVATSEYDYHGLHYDPETRKVSFVVKNLQAGCELTVGIKTLTPPTVTSVAPGLSRIDFYNQGIAKEDTLVSLSNITHAYMGSDKVDTFKVTYQYEGEVPFNAPSLDDENEYVEGATVNVKDDINIDGYIFSGWSSDDVTINNRSFTMPGENVVIKGSFTKAPTYTVTYDLSGDMPEGYALPLSKEYSQNETVYLDSLKEGDIVNGYKFLGWRSEEVTISGENDFIMPKKNVVIVGSFEPMRYKVTYAFYNTSLPSNYEDYLPEEEYYLSGEEVNLPKITNPDGYEFLGWYKQDKFSMPEEDITIYGEWREVYGTFTLSITSEEVDYKDFYKAGDTIKYKIIVTNNESFELKNIYVKSSAAGFIPNDNYTTETAKVAKIEALAPGEQAILYSSYLISDSDDKEIVNTSSITGASADNHYELTNEELKTTIKSNLLSKLTICNEVSSRYNDNVFDYILTSNEFETNISLDPNTCKTIYTKPGIKLSIKEVIPLEYNLNSVDGINNNGSSLNIEKGKNYKVTFNNSFVKKNFFHSFDRIINRIVRGSGS